MQKEAEKTITSTPPIPERILDGIPGYLLWIALVFSIIFAIWQPDTLLVIVAALGFYTALRFLLAGLANLRGLRMIKQWEQIDWYAKYQSDAPEGSLAWEDVHHVVIIPNYKEPEHILRKTLSHLAEQADAAHNMTVVLAMEAGEDGSEDKASILKADYANQFANIFYTVHPRGLPGEIQGKSSNLGWAGRWIKEELIDRQGYNPDHLVVTSTDADIVWHKNHFAALTYLFATNPDRYNRMYQAAIRYHGNIWEINPLLRIVNAYSTAFELAYLSASFWTSMPISSYSLSLNLLMACGFWDGDVMSDDWHTFIKSFFVRKGHFVVEPIYLPFLADAATGETFWEAVKERYNQTLRHAWGSKEVGYFIGRMLTDAKMPYPRTLRVLTRIAHDIFLAGAGWVLITAGSQLPIVLHPHLVPFPPERVLQNPAWLTISICGAVIVALGVVFWYLDVIVRPERDESPGWNERLLTLLSFPLLPILMLVFVSLPVIQAQTRLMFGNQLEYKVAKKF